MEQVVNAGGRMPRRKGRRLPVTYARPEQGLFRRSLITGIEYLSGRAKLERLYAEWDETRDPEEPVFSAAIRVLGIRPRVLGVAADAIPREGPLLILANHPFGIVDGLLIGHLVSRVRKDVKIMTHSLLCQPEAARDVLLPVDFGPGEAARRTSAETRRQAADWLDQGHALIVFPAGSVATAPTPLAPHAVDAEWHPFAARLAARPGVQTVLMHVHGQNSRLFQVASHLSYPLRVALILRETARRIGRPVTVTVAPPFELGQHGRRGRGTAAAELRRACWSMARADGADPDRVFVWPKHIRW